MFGIRSKKIKRFLVDIGALAALFAAVLAIYAYVVPDKSLEYAKDFSMHENNLNILITSIFYDNKAEFLQYKDLKKKMPDEIFKSIVLKVMASDENKLKAENLINYLDRISECESSFFCKISNFEINYDHLTYGTWFWLRPYINQTQSIHVGNFGVPLEKRANIVMKRIKNN